MYKQYQKGSDCDYEDYLYETPLSLAIKKNNYVVCEKLIKCGASVNDTYYNKEKEKRTCIDFAKLFISNPKVNILLLLI